MNMYMYYNTIIKGKQNNEGRREYRKGKQECHITPGNRIREIEKSRIVTRCLKPAGAGEPLKEQRKDDTGYEVQP